MPNVPPYESIWDLLNAGSVVPFLGAGASLIPRQPPPTQGPPGTSDTAWATWLPTGTQLREYLARKAALELTDNSQPELATVAQYYTWAVGRTDLCRNLHKIFAADYGFGPVHGFLAQLSAPLLILTTNYDDMLERAFRTHKKSFDLVIHQTDDEARSGSVMFIRHDTSEPAYIAPNDVDIDLSKVSVIYKMHGTVTTPSSPAESFVITEDDYLDFLTRMGSNTPIPSMIEDAFIDRHFLFLGYQLADWNFRVMLASLKEHLQKRPSWAIRDSGSPIEEAIWNSRGVRMFDMKVEEFVARISQNNPTLVPTT